MKPILFSTEMVQAILDGRKSQTRRIVKNKWALECLEAGFVPEYVTDLGNSFMHDWPLPGEVLWVREAHAKLITTEGVPFYVHKQPDPIQWQFVEDRQRWTPSIFMPKNACRLFLKIKKIRVERLQDISESDAVAEGIIKKNFGALASMVTRKNEPDDWVYKIYGTENDFDKSSVVSYYSLWDFINGEGEFLKNPWVWVIEFEKTEKPSGL